MKTKKLARVTAGSSPHHGAMFRERVPGISWQSNVTWFDKYSQVGKDGRKLN
jgi:hypothetical protein